MRVEEVVKRKEWGVSGEEGGRGVGCGVRVEMRGV